MIYLNLNAYLWVSNHTFYHPCIINASSMHNSCIILALPMHHPYIIHTSSVHYLYIIRTSFIYHPYECIINSLFVHHQWAKHALAIPWFIHANLMEWWWWWLSPLKKISWIVESWSIIYDDPGMNDEWIVTES